MESAVDVDVADFSSHTHSSASGSRRGGGMGSSHSGITGLTGVDVESGEASLLVGGRGHRSTYTELAAEALLGAVGPPSDPEGAFERPFEAPQAVDVVLPDHQDAAWRMGSAGTFWRLDSGVPMMQARCCVGPDEYHKDAVRGPSGSQSRGSCKIILTACASIAVLVVCWHARAFFIAQALGTPAFTTQRQGCCTAPTALCFACRAGVDIEAYCRDQGRARGVLGCEEPAPVCCGQEKAECLACKSALSVTQFCGLPANADVLGCGDDTCGLVEHGVAYTGGDLYSVGGVSSAGICCTICREEAQCTAWSWAGEEAVPASSRNRCLLKRPAELLFGPAKGFVSGLPGRDVTQIEVKSRHGMCLDVVAGEVQMQACRLERAAQEFAFERRLGRLSTSMGDCLEAAGGEVSVRRCHLATAGQHWAFDSERGLLMSGSGGGSSRRCLHAARRQVEGAKVGVQACDASLSEQHWGLWSSQVLLEQQAVHEETTRAAALVVTTTTQTRTETTTSTSSKPPMSLFCFELMVPWGYEPDLVRMQMAEKRSIFTCEGFAVYSNTELLLGPGPSGRAVSTRVVEGTDLHCEKGGEFMTLLNTPVFKRVWEQVLRDGLFRTHDWTVKVDCDAVFFPDRLRLLLEGPALQDPQEGSGLFVNNCGFGLHGPLEVLSRQSLETYANGFERCDQPPQEDVYLQACMNKLGVKQVNQFALLSEEACRTPNWEKCQSPHVSFHPFKDVEAYRQCAARAEKQERFRQLHVQ